MAGDFRCEGAGAFLVLPFVIDFCAMPSTSSSPLQQGFYSLFLFPPPPLISYSPASSPPPSRSPSQSPLPQDFLTLRALVSTKDAGVIIGKGGKNVAELRDQTGVKAGVSKVIPGVHERVLTITGVVKSVAFVRLYFLIPRSSIQLCLGYRSGSQAARRCQSSFRLHCFVALFIPSSSRSP